MRSSARLGWIASVIALAFGVEGQGQVKVDLKDDSENSCRVSTPIADPDSSVSRRLCLDQWLLDSASIFQGLFNSQRFVPDSPVFVLDSVLNIGQLAAGRSPGGNSIWLGPLQIIDLFPRDQAGLLPEAAAREARLVLGELFSDTASMSVFVLILSERHDGTASGPPLFVVLQGVDQSASDLVAAARAHGKASHASEKPAAAGTGSIDSWMSRTVIEVPSETFALLDEFYEVMRIGTSCDILPGVGGSNQSVMFPTGLDSSLTLEMLDKICRFQLVGYRSCVAEVLKCELYSLTCFALVPISVAACSSVCAATVVPPQPWLCVACVIAGAGGTVAACELAWDCWLSASARGCVPW